MASWQEFERQAPELAGVARRLMEGCRHRVMATLRKDGSPRVSGIETSWRDGQLWTGSMPGAVKAFDLRRDPRMAIHVASAEPDMEDPPAWEGDVKLAGRALEVTDPAVLAAFESDSGSHLFRIELTEVVWTRVEGDELVMDAWHDGDGVRRIRRK
ncbi:pyridoxamine 5-phosphate oxidase [Nonomuraea mesophila]|uniref:Pyridoxamine 5-phosphate oxidase n=1 Tax=Nonomuraea mesophila TaxID=2530382 RepID=A0A4R5EWS9_9ACTN|nr:pyridoxamine 5'-phosphate oxidase family protein [Nonomuraea mesophila]TDE39310.1 pyridoxamine 5-phosphate oxidase [Nonomuraea mesophila]